MKKVPKIRFKEFKGDWEQRKLGEIFEEYSEKNHPELPALTIIQGSGTVKREESDRNLIYDKSNLSGYKMVRKDDFIVHLRSFEGGLEKASSEGIISPAYHTFHGENVDSRFYYSYFRSHEFIKRKLIAHVYGIRDGRSIDIDGMKTIEIPYTPYNEQCRIGGYLESLDRLITLHQHKCEEMKKLKKLMLQKMFPQNGANVPEIRFDSFTGVWDQRKVADIAEIIAGGTPNTKMESYWKPKEIPWLSSGEVHKKYITFTDDMISEEGMNNSSAKMVKENSVLIALAGQGKTRGTVAINRISLTTNQSIAAMTFDENIVPEFVFYNLENRYDEIRRMSSGDGSRGGLNKQLIGDIKIPYTSKQEQERIGSYFVTLDHLITLHQHEIESYKKMKQYMLQNMFV